MAQDKARGVGLALLAAVLAYANVWWGVFQFDDYNVIVNNPRVHTLEAWWLDAGQGIRPLLKLSYTLDWLFGRGEAAFHFTNLLIHLGTTWLVWRLTRRFVAAQPRLQVQPGLPLLVALLFAVHPVHTEAVIYISGRSSSLMALLYLAGLLAYAEGVARQNRWLLHGAVPLAMLLALASKETAATFPLALLLWELALGGNLKMAWQRQWVSWLTLLLAVIYFFAHAAYRQEMETSAALNSFSGNLATQGLAIAYLLRQWLLPLWLNIDPELPVLPGGYGVWPTLLLLVAAAGMTAYWLRHRPWLGFALGWSMIQLVPLYVLLPRIDVANERQLYLASWPLLLGVLGELSCRVRFRELMRAVAALTLLLAGLTLMRNADYGSEVALWQATAQLSPGKARVHNNLGYAYLLQGRMDAARAEFVTALRLDPRYYRARFNLLRVELAEEGQ